MNFEIRNMLQQCHYHKTKNLEKLRIVLLFREANIMKSLYSTFDFNKVFLLVQFQVFSC